MSRVTSRSREMTRSRCEGGERNVLPRELDEDEYSAAMSGVDDVGDQYLFFTVPAAQYDGSPAPWMGDTGSSTGRTTKTKVWRCINSGNGGVSGLHASMNDSQNASERCDDGVTCNGSSRHHHATKTDHTQVYDDRHGSNTSTNPRVRVETRLMSTGHSPSSPLSPVSPRVLSPTSRPSAIPVRVPVNSGEFHHIDSVSLYKPTRTHHHHRYHHGLSNYRTVGLSEWAIIP